MILIMKRLKNRKTIDETLNRRRMLCLKLNSMQGKLEMSKSTYETAKRNIKPSNTISIEEVNKSLAYYLDDVRKNEEEVEALKNEIKECDEILRSLGYDGL